MGADVDHSTRDYFNHNSEHLRARWPEVWNRVVSAPSPHRIDVLDDAREFTLFVDGIQLSSCYDRAREAEQQAALIPMDSETGWVYGVGTGDLINVLLTRPHLRKLHVVIMNAAVFRASLRHFDHGGWLADDRVELHFADGQHDINTPFAAVPACLALAESSASRLKELVVLELNTPYINRRFNTNPTFIDQLATNRERIAGDGDVCELFGTQNGGTVCVVGAGPTLGDHFQRLREAQRQGHVIVAVDAALKPLLLERIVPDVVVTIDGKREGILPYFAMDLDDCRNTPLVYFPVVHPDVLTRWPGPRLTAYSASPLFETVARQWPKGVLFASGSVIHPAVDVAVKLGAGCVQLVGADFSYPYGRSHVVMSVFAREIDDQNAPGQVWLTNGEGRRVRSVNNLCGYLRDLERYIARHGDVSFINMSRQGAWIAGADYLE